MKRILEENARPGGGPGEPKGSLPGNGEPSIEYEKIPRLQRKPDRIESAVDPQARTGFKSGSTVIRGYKTQNLCTGGGVILSTKVVPANEHDREAMYEMVRTVKDFFGIAPQAVSGDTAYGHGKQRAQLAALGIRVVAPVTDPVNPVRLYGTQYYLGKETCSACPLRSECTTNAGGRTVFRSDYVDLYEQARAFNESFEGRFMHTRRYVVERKNNELKNDCGLGRPRTRGRKSLQIKALLAAMVVNLKHTVRKLANPSAGFIRRAQIV